MSAAVLLTACALAALVSYLFSRHMALPWLRRHGVLDHPTARSSHDEPVVRGGGIAVGTAHIAVTVLSLLVCLFLLKDVGSAAPGEQLLLALLPLAAGLAFGVVGLIDDFNSLSASSRLVAQLFLAALFTSGVVVFAQVGIAGALAILLSIVLVVNGTNFMDGLNTLITSWGALTGLWFAVVALFADQPFLAVSAIVLVGALLGFLPLNWSPAHAFLGDVGSYAIGGFLGVLFWVLWGAGAPAAMVLAPFVIPIFDVLYTLVRRLAAGENIFVAHRSHVYQRLHAAGLRHEQAAGAHLAAVALCILAVIPSSVFAALPGMLTLVCAWALVVALYALSPSLVTGLKARRGGVERA